VGPETPPTDEPPGNVNSRLPLYSTVDPPLFSNSTVAPVADTHWLSLVQRCIRKIRDGLLWVENELPANSSAPASSAILMCGYVGYVTSVGTVSARNSSIAGPSTGEQPATIHATGNSSGGLVTSQPAATIVSESAIAVRVVPVII